MNRGVKLLFVVASLAMVGCAIEPGAVEVRPIKAPGARLRPGDALLADAKGQLALGNAGLALEGFRKAARDNPDSVDALAGMAACYDAMGRFDLAQAKYEAALALAPRNPALLNALAASLDRQGDRQGAAEIRTEVASLTSASAALDQTNADVEAAAASLQPAQTVVVALPAPQPAPRVAEVALPRPQLAQQAEVALSSVGPIARPGIAALRLSDVFVAIPDEAPAIAMPTPRLADRAAVDIQTSVEPRLQRMSLGEVALLTMPTPVPTWRGQVVARSKQSVTVRWVPLQTASARPNIRLLNAARRQGLAARSRDYLLARGWRKIDIGDSAELREQSVVLYPAARQALGRSLAAQFGFPARPGGTGNVFVVLLGRDAPAAKATPPRG